MSKVLRPISRRTLAQGALGLVPLAFLGRMAKAQGAGHLLAAEPNAHFFLFVQVYGAWDVCLAFDPKNRELLLPNGERQFDQPYAMDEVRDFGGIPLAPVGHVLGKYADRMAIINGIDMEVDGGHTSDSMMTGVTTARATGSPYVQAVLSKRHPFLKKRSVPHLYTAYDGQFLGGPYALGSISASPADFLSVIGVGGESTATTDLRAMLAEYQAGLSSPVDRRVFGSYVGAADGALAVTRSLKDFGFEAPADIAAPAGLGSFLGQLFASGVLGSATLSLGSKYMFDTHSNHYAEHPLAAALAEVEGVMESMKQVRLSESESVFDRTTVVLTAEYARTPRLNDFAGKDHNFRTNSCVMIGKGVRPGVYGQSGVRLENGSYEAHAGLPIDFATGRPDANGKLLMARNIWAGFGGIAGVSLASEFGNGTSPIQFLG